MKHALSSVILLCLSAIAYANPIDEEGARQVAEKFYRQAMNHSYGSQLLGRANTRLDLQLAYKPQSGTISESSAPEYYVYTTADSVGFVIVAGDDAVEPVIGYSLDGTFSTHQLPPALNFYLDSYRRYIRDVRTKDIVPEIKTSQSFSPVEPFIHTQWNQNYPYNTYTPTLFGQRTLVGCVAIATAQIMRYYKWPVAGHGTCYATLDDGWETVVSRTLGEVYEWDKIGYYYSEAVGKLVRDVGYACSVCYGTSATWAYDISALKALLRNFDYSPQMQLVDRRYYSNSGWHEILSTEMQEGRPVYISGQDTDITTGGQDGHAFVCCGLDSNGYFYINWGWGGSYDGYFNIDVLAPYDYYNYSSEQEAIINIKPIEESEDPNNHTQIPHVGGIELEADFSDAPVPTLDYRIYVTNTSDQTIAGTVGYSVYQNNKELSAGVREMSYYDEIQPGWYSWWDQYITLDDIGEITDGIREIRFMWKPDGSNEWHTPLGENNIIYVETIEGEHYFDTVKPDYIPDNIDDIASDNLDVRMRDNGIYLTASTDMAVNIYSINGILMRTVSLQANARQIILLPQGIYVVNGKRVVVQ